MKYATLRVKGGTEAAVQIDGSFHSIGLNDLGAFLASGETATAQERLCSVDDADYAPVIPRPRKIFCVGINYLPHIKEVGMAIPEAPTLFSKHDNALIGANDDLDVFHISKAIDWEAELVVVVGKRVFRADVEAAENAIFGFCVGNDVSARDLQTRTQQWDAGKTIDKSAPVGPWLVSKEAVGVRPDLNIRCLVNDEMVQQDQTGELKFDPVELVRDISQFATLESGDLIFTGTPGGVGGLRNPPWFLKPGDVLTTEIDELGACRNRCV